MLLAKKEKEPTLPMPPRRSPIEEVESGIADLARTVKPSLGDSRNMERAKTLLTNGLTAAYSDGAAALDAAVQQADEELTKLKAAVKEADIEMDRFKREAAEHILELKNKSAQLTAEVEARVEHLTTMVRWVEDQRAMLKEPPAPKQIAVPASPAKLAPPMTEEEDKS
jgi:DNA repair exonuclease SbcCD ATPase subunit